MTRQIPLTRGYVALVDDEDFDWLSQWKWCLNGHYAVRRQRKAEAEGGHQKMILLHRQIMGFPADLQVDHADRNKLNCTRQNLRVCTASENVCNRVAPPRRVAPYRGINFHYPSGRWAARIKIRGRVYTALTFKDPLDAARAYDELARKHHGEFAVLNFPDKAA